MLPQQVWLNPSDRKIVGERHLCCICWEGELCPLLLHTGTNIMQDRIIHSKTRVDMQPTAQLYDLSLWGWCTCAGALSVFATCSTYIRRCTLVYLCSLGFMSDYNTTHSYLSAFQLFMSAFQLFFLKFIFPMCWQNNLPQHKIQGTPT